MLNFNKRGVGPPSLFSIRYPSFVLFAVLVPAAIYYIATGFAPVGVTGARLRYMAWAISALFFCFSWIFLFILYNKSGSFRVSSEENMPIVNGYQRWVLVYFLVSIGESVSGFSLGNNLNYLAGDFVKSAMLIFGFVLARFVLMASRDGFRIMRYIALMVFFPGLGAACVGYPFVYSLCQWIRRNTIFGFFFMAFSVAFIAYSAGKSGTLMIIGVMFILFYILFLRVFKKAVFVLMMVFIIPAGILMVSPHTIYSSGAYQKWMQLYSHFNSSDYNKLDVSTYERIREFVLIKNKFKRHGGVYSYLFGFGNGAQYRFKANDSLQSFYNNNFGGFAHHIHLTPVFIFHQWGLVGLGIYVWLFVLLWRSVQFLKRNRAWMHEPCYTLALTSLVMFLSTILYGMVNPPKMELLPAGLLLGLHVGFMNMLHRAVVPRQVVLSEA